MNITLRLSHVVLVLSVCLAHASSLVLAEEGWIELFNGKDLSNWKISENPSSFSVVDGNLVVNGNRAHAYFIGESGGADFQNFHLRAQVKTMPSANSGIYFHTRYLADSWPNRGYEAQVNNSHGDPKKTGGLYDVQDNYKAVAKDHEWFDYEIIVLDPYIIVKIDGNTVSDYREPDDLDRPTRQLASGTFAIQAHDPNSTVLFRKLQVRRLP